MKIKIPKKIEVIGSTVEIIWDEEYCERFGVLGQADVNHNKIFLKKIHENKKFTDDALVETFLHELVHFMMRKLGKTDLNADETFVESFSNVLHQVIKQL